jgi:hypothetical protein
MKTNLLSIFTAVLLFLVSTLSFGQTAPVLGTTSTFALFTAAGTLTATGTPTITGDIGSFTVTPTGLPGSGTVTGTIYTVGDPALTQPASDVATAYGDFTGGTVLGVGLGNGQTLTPGVYNTGAASTLDGNLTLDGQGNSNALFIIRIGGAFSANANSTVTLINLASSSNVYWQIDGEFDLADGSVFMGTVVADGAINLFGTSVLHGRALSTSGAISLVSNTVDITPFPKVGTGIASINAENVITVAPNPFSTFITINIKDVTKTHNYKLLVFNDIGTEVMNSILNQQLTTFHTSNLHEGIYFYKVVDNDKIIQSGKLISNQY